jgi:hypothetical protein
MGTATIASVFLEVNEPLRHDFSALMTTESEAEYAGLVDSESERSSLHEHESPLFDLGFTDQDLQDGDFTI